MKLTEVLKSQIDSYFDQISADELYNVLTHKYHLPDADDIYDQGEYFSYPSFNYDVDILNYSDVAIDENTLTISEEASRLYIEAA